MAASSLDVHRQLQGEGPGLPQLYPSSSCLWPLPSWPQVTQDDHLLSQEAKSRWPLHHWEDLLVSLCTPPSLWRTVLPSLLPDKNGLWGKGAEDMRSSSFLEITHSEVVEWWEQQGKVWVPCSFRWRFGRGAKLGIKSVDLAEQMANTLFFLLICK